eukprot:UN33447
MKKNDSIDLIINFNPKIVGDYTENFEILCDNDQSFTKTINATAVDIDLTLTHVDNVSLDNKDDTNQKNSLVLYFDNVTAHSSKTKTATFHNKTILPLKYTWVVIDMNKECKQDTWVVNCSEGCFDSSDTTDIDIIFSPDHLTHEKL